MRTLLLGLGNPILTDDAVGVRLAHDIAMQLPRAPGLEVFAECSVGGLNLVERLVGFDRVIVIDSIRTAGGSPGDWYRFTAAALRDTMNLRNIHDTNFATALALGRRLGFPLPSDDAIHVFAVEVRENATFGAALSESLAQAYSDLHAAILTEIRALLASETPREASPPDQRLAAVE